MKLVFRAEVEVSEDYLTFEGLSPMEGGLRVVKEEVERGLNRMFRGYYREPPHGLPFLSYPHVKLIKWEEVPNA